MSLAKRILLWIMGAFYVLAGAMHFARPDFYRPMMPPYLPAHDALIFLSGVGEVLCGLGVLFPPTRKLAAWGTIALLVAVFPANIHVAVNDVPVFGATEGAGPIGFVRLPLQLVLIAWAWWYTRDEQPRSLRPEAVSS